MTKKIHKVIIIGSGPAGYTAGIYASRANMQPIIITGMEQGGQLTTTTDVDNWPGDHSGLQGPDLMQRMLDHAKKFNAEVVFDQIKDVDFSSKPFTLTGEYDTYRAHSVIIATGAKAKMLGIPSEAEFFGKGVSTCATCDGFFYKGKKVFVIGGGNTAVEEALYLSNIASEVVLVHRRDQLRAEKMLASRVIEKSKTANVTILWDSVLDEILGDESGVTGIRIKNTKTDALVEHDCLGVFIAIGHKPNTDLFQGKLDMRDGYIQINSGLAGEVTATNIPGVFAAGDVADSVYRQAITSAGFGCMAALDAEKYVDSIESNINQ
ncbi:MAG: thioredoxin-disulfide reductase [Pseudomonadota bacterium]|nr:thioredoxin-disulfide reductase [Pseudomonadota bacterium]